MKRLQLLCLLLIAALLIAYPVQAQSTPVCHYEPDGSIVCTMGGGGGGGGGGGDEDDTCTPGDHLEYHVTGYDPDTQTCSAIPVIVDNCSGQVIEAAGDAVDDLPCTLEEPPPPNPCETLSVGGGGVTCDATQWNVTARVSFPVIYLDVRPYPATLVRWPTALRNGGLPEASGSDSVDYISHGGGSPGNPQVGDWRDLRLILTLRPAGSMYVSLPHIGELTLPVQGPTGSPTLIQWEVPSHPAVGGGPLAGSVGGLEELPADIPLFVGRGRAPYRLFWEVRYYVYQAIRECMSGPDGSGAYDCGGGGGHMEIVGYEWHSRTNGGEIPPTAVQNLPASVMADLNGDGHPDAYWDHNLTLRRMDDSNRVDNPRYQRSWNWGGIIYWAVREGQGQIGWPAMP
ncbi:MAG: hypothetical protein ACOYZ8_13130 [Chloroflexota bacterium]